MPDLSCPWTQFEPSTLHWCENQVCGWIREPANTWSNLAYLFAGIWVLYKYRSQETKHLRLLGIYALLLAVTSGLYHASGTFAAEVADFSTMFLFSSYYFSANCARIWHWSFRKFTIIAVALLVSSICLLLAYKTIGIELFAFQFVGSILLELYIYLKYPARAYYLGFIISLSSFVVAYAIWWLDVLKVVCSPDTHWISGHAIWHLLNGVGIVAVASFYAQFDLMSRRSDDDQRRNPQTNLRAK